MLFPPLIIMLCVTFTALVQRLIAMVEAISNAAKVTIPAGETTWGNVVASNIEEIENQIQELSGALNLSRVICSRKDDIESFDEEFYWKFRC